MVGSTAAARLPVGYAGLAKLTGHSQWMNGPQGFAAKRSHDMEYPEGKGT